MFAYQELGFQIIGLKVFQKLSIADFKTGHLQFKEEVITYNVLGNLSKQIRFEWKDKEGNAFNIIFVVSCGKSKHYRLSLLISDSDNEFSSYLNTRIIFELNEYLKSIINELRRALIELTNECKKDETSLQFFYSNELKRFFNYMDEIQVV